ncbi:MAG TPA: S24/S26 family peptidase [Gemmatimonadaceae bacterium]|nr:S24/S26 family peptidase [Gemmatimonadaceae bacterium]
MAVRHPETDGLRLIAKELQLRVSSKQRTLHFHGESMRPFLVEGDEVVVEPVEWSCIRPGDVITYRHLDRFPTRRVVRVAEDSLVLWCENWPDRTFRAAREDILGRAVARRRAGAWLAASDLRWRLARASARLRWELRQARYVRMPEILDRARRAPKKILRMVGKLPPPRTR